MLNSASRSRSVVGRTVSDFGPTIGRERRLPPTTRIILTLVATDAARRSGRDDVFYFHCGHGRQPAGRALCGVRDRRRRALRNGGGEPLARPRWTGRPNPRRHPCAFFAHT